MQGTMQVLEQLKAQLAERLTEQRNQDVAQGNRKHQKRLQSFEQTLLGVCAQRTEVDELLHDSIRHGSFALLRPGTYYWVFGAMRQPKMLNLPHCEKGEILGLVLPSLETITSQAEYYGWRNTHVGGLLWKDRQVARGMNEASAMFRLTTARLNCFQVKSSGRSILITPSAPIVVVDGIAPANKRKDLWELIVSQDAPVSMAVA